MHLYFTKCCVSFVPADSVILIFRQALLSASFILQCPKENSQDFKISQYQTTATQNLHQTTHSLSLTHTPLSTNCSVSSDFRSEFAGDRCSQGPPPACRLLLRRVRPPFGVARLQQPVSSRSPQTPWSRQFRPLGLRHGQSRQGSLLHHPGLSNGVPRYKRGARGGVPLPRMQSVHVHCVWWASSRWNDMQHAPQLQGNRRWSWRLGAERPQEPKSMPRLSEPRGEDIGLQQDALHSLPHCLLLAVHPAVRHRGSLLWSLE